MAKAPYPGEMASAAQVQALADEYRKASDMLREFNQKGQPLALAPYRLIAIHAIELYLNAFLLRRGHAAEEIRGLQHDLSARADLALGDGLKLRDKTAKHLRSLSEAREYLVTRYDPDLAGATPQLNRLWATLKDVAKKVATAATLAPAKGAASEARAR